MIALAREQRVRRWEELERALASTFLVAAAEMMELLPDRWLDDRDRNLTAGDRRLDGAGRAPILEAGRCALLRKCLRTFDVGVLRLMSHDPGADREHVDPLLRTDAGHRNVDRFKQLRRGTVVDLDESETAAHTGINAEDSGHGTLLNARHASWISDTDTGSRGNTCNTSAVETERR